MKTKEFMERVEGLGYSIFHPEEGLMRIEKNKLTSCEYYATVSIDGVYELDLNFIDFINMSNSEKEPLFSLIVQYASTPLEEREEEKKYVYRLPIKNNNDCAVHLYKKTNDEIRLDHSSFDYVLDVSLYHFTDKELEQYAGNIRVLFQSCEKIEVTP